jgi:hypothetical protein
MNIQDFLLPYVISNLIGITLLWLCWKKPVTGRLVFSIIFLAAGLFNYYTASTEPEAYTMYADGAWLTVYKNFINGYFSEHVALLVKLIASGQMLVAVLLFTKKGITHTLGIAGGIIFLIAISPLGIGSAFPATLIMAGALVLCHDRFIKSRKGYNI